MRRPNTLTACQPANAVYTVQVAATCAWIGNVTLSASGLPGGVTAAWGANPVTPPGSTTLTIGNTEAAAVGSYNVTITGASGSTTRSETVVLNILSSDPLGAVSLLSLADGTLDAATAPTLSWLALAGASSYDIEVATDPAFANVVRTASGLTATSYTVSPALSQDTVYYWRVSANNVCGAGAVSATWAFRTGATRCVTTASTDVPKTINSNSGILSTLTSPSTYAVTDVNVTIGSLIHSNDQELDIHLLGPDDTTVELSTDNGGTGDNYTNTVFDDEASTAITAGSAPFTGSYRPEGTLSAFDGKSSTGANAWRLRVVDDTSGYTGTLNSWSLTLCGAPVASASDYSDLAGSYGAAWHLGGKTGVATVRLGETWTADSSFAAGHDDAGSGDGSDDGVTIASFSETEGVLSLTVTGRTGYVTGWFDWNQDGDFSDAGEQVFANQEVSAGSVTPVSFSTGGVSVYDETFNARFRVYTVAQAAAEPLGGATDGEVEDYTWYFEPQAVTLAGFSAEATADGVMLSWETVSEVENAGFNVYRAAGGSVGDRPQQEGGDPLRMTGWVRLNEMLIPAATPGSAQGNVYTWTDTAALTGTIWYMLEDVDLNGTATRHEPVSVTVAGPNAVGMASFSAGYDGGWAGLYGLFALAAAAAIATRRRH